MYDPHLLLNVIDQNKWWILGGFTIAMIFQWIWLIKSIKIAKRERVYSIPLFCTFFWFAHDTGCVARFSDWFNVYDHWYLKCFWFGLLTAAILELIFFGQVIKYGKDELLPGVSTRLFILGLVAFQIAASLTWEYFKSVMGDPLYQLSTPATVVAYPLFGGGANDPAPLDSRPKRHHVVDLHGHDRLLVPHNRHLVRKFMAFLAIHYHRSRHHDQWAGDGLPGKWPLEVVYPQTPGRCHRHGYRPAG
jgi:lipid-A-disaccharide synthase-like uncharacterized protein